MSGRGERDSPVGKSSHTSKKKPKQKKKKKHSSRAGQSSHGTGASPKPAYPDEDYPPRPTKPSQDDTEDIIHRDSTHSRRSSVASQSSMGSVTGREYLTGGRKESGEGGYGDYDT